MVSELEQSGQKMLPRGRGMDFSQVDIVVSGRLSSKN